ncbi:type II toxin-antitoxin system RelE/ParE family toxin [Aphanizomenon sp. PH219]|uniref:type II toxin-antitoxin system RelE/ParE family toxin n=1 Tax=Aphanizomenon flos-aquae TaxID=1176 RepID=UPI0004833F3D|nr:type II toxin-antitoxin system RelE/ParE family toxin [Aphanizomenon flos-aquae]MDK2410512.1 type II toxin-antitoxin system RelE/ParE family toxin [Aphanizomenon sp. 202]MDK2462704.1 type II toxin-antitoxin system RelE/ParE family toxin [Aphanizomenon sp. PH219]
MEWNIIFDPDFRIWFYQQEQGFQNEVFAVLGILAKFRPSLGRPRVDTLEGSDFSNMKKLRIQHQGEPWRILFAFDPKRQAILLVGGNKAGNKKWYKENIAIADKRYREYLETIKEEKS